MMARNTAITYRFIVMNVGYMSARYTTKGDDAMHNTPEQNEAFRKAWDATNALWRAQQKAFEAQKNKGKDNAKQQ